LAKGETSAQKVSKKGEKRTGREGHRQKEKKKRVERGEEFLRGGGKQQGKIYSGNPRGNCSLGGVAKHLTKAISWEASEQKYQSPGNQVQKNLTTHVLAGFAGKEKVAKGEKKKKGHTSNGNGTGGGPLTEKPRR